MLLKITLFFTQKTYDCNIIETYSQKSVEISGHI